MPRFYVSSITLSLAIVLLASCASHKTEAILNDVETYVKERPDSALSTIRTIDTTSLKTPRLRAHYALLHAMALDKNWIDTTDANVVMPAVEYYDRHPSGIRRAKAWYYLGRIQENGGDIPEASISFLKADRYSENCDDIAFKSLVYQEISDVYNKTYFYKEALRYTEMSYELAVQDGDTVGANASLFRLAQDYNNVGSFAESDSLYNLLINEDNIHPNLRASLLSNYALNLVTRGKDINKAVSVFEEVIDKYGTLNRMNFWGAYAYALILSGQTEHANRIFNQLEKKSQGNATAFIYASWKSLADAYEGDFPSAYQLQREASETQTENMKKLLEQSSIKAQKDFLDEMNQESEKEANRRLLMMRGIITALIFLVLLLVFVFKRKNARSAREKESLIETYRELTSRTEEEKAKVRNQYIQMCQSHFSHIGRINEMLNIYARESNDNLYRELKRSIQRVGLDEDSQQRFEKMLDDSFDGVMIHFRDSFPGKKPRFYQLVSYLFAGFGTTTICTIIPGYNKHNIHVEKWRLKQLIQGSESSYKEQFLEMLS